MRLPADSSPNPFSVNSKQPHSSSFASHQRNPPGQFGEALWFLGFAFPHDEQAPAEFAQSALLEFVARGVACKFLHPESAMVRGRGAVLTAFVAMPEAAVDEEGSFVFGQEDVGADEEG